MTDKIRTCLFRPYGNNGARFRLDMYDTGRYDNRGCTYIRYTFSFRSAKGAPAVTLFEGSDFAGSPLHADDSDETVRSLMTFLTIRPSADRTYCANYTETQLAFCSEHAETLSCEVMARYGEG